MHEQENTKKKFGNKPEILLFCLFFLSAPVSADQYHYKNIIVGERASGMGGAYTAISDDPSGLYYNPAGIVYAQSDNLSASVNAYNNAEKTYKDALAGSIDWKRRSAALLPNFFAFTQKLGDGVVGFSYAVPDSITENQDQSFENPTPAWSSFIINFNDNDRTYNIGPSYAIEVTKGFSVGATLYLHYRERERISNEIAVNSFTNETQLSNSQFETSEFGYQPMIGFMFTPLNKWSFGLNISKTIIADSSTTVESNVKAFGDETIQRSVTKTDEKRELPLAVSVGVAWFPTPALLFSSDIFYYSEAEDEISGTRESRINWAVGMEYYLTPSWALRSGVYSNYSNAPGLVEGATDQVEHINYYGLSLSASRVTRTSTVTLGLGYTQGSGLAQVVSGSADIQDVEANSLSVTLSSSYAY